MKICTQCQQKKSLNLFYNHKGKKIAACKECTNERNFISGPCNSALGLMDENSKIITNLIKYLKARKK